MSYFTKTEKAIIGVGIAGIILYLAVFLTFPLVCIWALNILFPLLSIPYSFTSYIAMLVVNWVLMGSHAYNTKKLIDKL